MRMTRKGLMTAVVVVSSACAGGLATAAQASPGGGLVPTVWSCVDVANGATYTAYVSLPAAFNAPGQGASHAVYPGMLTGYTAAPGEPALPLGAYQVLDSNGNKTGVASGTVLTCTIVNPAIGVTLTVAHADS